MRNSLDINAGHNIGEDMEAGSTANRACRPGIVVSVVVVNWRSSDYLRECLRSLGTRTNRTPYEVIVIDNASFDGVDKMLADEFPWVRFIQSEKNLGFAQANNLASRMAGGKHLLFLNPDTELANEAIDLLSLHLETLPNAGIVGPLLFNSDLSVQSTCVKAFPTIINQMLDSRILRRAVPRSRLWGMACLFMAGADAKPVDGIVGACLMIKKHVFEQVGRFGTEYFMYTEDIDLCYKVRQLGYRNYLVRAARVIHHGGKSSEQKADTFSVVQWRKSTFYFLKRSQGVCYAWVYRLAMGLTGLMRIALLSAIWPFARTSRNHNHHSIRRWSAVVRWSVGLAE